MAPPGSEVMAESPQGIVYEDGSTVPFQLNAPTAFTGCPKATGRERVLPVNTFQSEDEEMGATGAATAGQYAALATFNTDIHYGGSADTLVVYNLQTGNSIPNLGGEIVACGGYSCTTTMDGIVINRQGFTAVHTTVMGYCGSYSDICQETIQAADSGGPRTLDTATPTSSSNPMLTDLTLSGDTLAWKHGGTPESTELH